MIDLDHFKHINDGFGHQAGDLVLARVAALLKAEVRGSDMACRYGGEEFVIVVPDTSLETARRRAEAICQAVKRLEFTYCGRRLGPITASLGVVVFPDQADSADALIGEADRLLYDAKSRGRDRVLTSEAQLSLHGHAPVPASET
jgi:diguanylate cyclase (GGDEF)-like protein